MNYSGGVVEEQHRYQVNIHFQKKQRNFIDVTSEELGTDRRRALTVLNNLLSACPKILSNGGL